MNATRTALLNLVFITLPFFSLAQSTQPLLLKTLSAYNDSFPEEKIYVHFDKTVYSEGETIWFKAYLSSQNFPSMMSTSLYAELLDLQGNVIAKRFIPVYEATSAGSFDLPAKLNTTGLIFRAYTPWMLNFDSSYIYNRVVRITSPHPQTTATTTHNTTLRFFPEGGDLVADFESVIAFKATDENGYPASVSGMIKDNSGKQVAVFKTIHDGMGKLNFEPALGKTYYADWKDESGKQYNTQLPAAKTTGLLLEAKELPGYVTYVIKRSDDVLPPLKKVHVIAQMHQQVVYRANINMDKITIISGVIKTDSLATGILQFTLFDSAWKPMAERLVFVRTDNFSFPSDVHILKKDLEKRGKNIIEIEVPDSIRSNLSISVTDSEIESPANQDNIYSALLMTGDLRGYIHNPDYYFSGTADSIRQHLDLLMLTNGWRRYNWDAIATGKLPVVKYRPENFLTLKGNVYGVRGNEATNQLVNLILQTKDSARQYLFAPLDSKGEFSLDGLVYFDTISVYYQFNTNNRLNRIATVNFKSDLPKYPVPSIDIDRIVKLASNKPVNTRNAYFASLREEVIPQLNRKVKTLEEVVVRSQVKTRETQLEKKYTSGLFQSGNSKTFNLLDDPFAMAAQNALTYLEGRVAGLYITSTGSDYTASWRSGTPAFFLDEMPTDIEDISRISVSDIALIKVFSPPFIGAFGNGAGGAIAIYRKKGGDDDTKRPGKGMEKGRAVGYSPIKEFYSPDYAESSPLHEVDDIRSTIYWNPYILTDKTTRKIRLEFYNNDFSKAYRIVLEGMNMAGKLTRVEKVIR